MNPVTKTMSKHSFKYEHLKAQLKSDEERVRTDLDEASRKFEKKWNSRVLGFGLTAAIIGLGYYRFSPKKKPSKKAKNKEKTSYKSRSLVAVIYSLIGQQIPIIFEKIFKEMANKAKVKE